MGKGSDPAEIDMMSEVDKHPGVHAESTQEEQDVLQEMYGAPDEKGIYGCPVDAEEAS